MDIPTTYRAWHAAAQELNARPPLDESTIVFVSVNYQGLEYPKYYTTLGGNLPEGIDMDRVVTALESGEEAEASWAANVTGVVQLVGPGWSGGDPLPFATCSPDLVLDVVPERTIRGSGEDPGVILMDSLDGDPGGCYEYDTSYWEPADTSIYPRLAAMGIPTDQWWDPLPRGRVDICEIPSVTGMLEDSDARDIRMLSDGGPVSWFPNTEAGRWNLARRLVYLAATEVSLDGGRADVHVVGRTAKELFRNAYRRPRRGRRSSATSAAGSTRGPWTASRGSSPGRFGDADHGRHRDRCTVPSFRYTTR